MVNFVRYTTKNEDGSYDYDKHLAGEAMDVLGGYEDAGLTPEEITRLHTLIKQQGEELQRRDLLIKELDKERDFWERAAKKWCIELGKIREDAAKELCD